MLPALKVGKLWRFPAHDTQIRLYKQKQKQGSAKTDHQKSGWGTFLKLATNLGYVETVRR
jgi:hypothetical protein